MTRLMQLATHSTDLFRAKQNQVGVLHYHRTSITNTMQSHIQQSTLQLCADAVAELYERIL